MPTKRIIAIVLMYFIGRVITAGPSGAEKALRDYESSHHIASLKK